MSKPLPKPPAQPWLPTEAEPADVWAVKNIAAGNASEGQQKRFLAFVINQVCRTYDMSFRPGPDGERATAFAEGRRAVGNELVRMVNTDVRKLPTQEQG